MKTLRGMLDATALAATSSFIAFGIVGAVDAYPVARPVLFTAGMLYGLLGALTAAFLTAGIRTFCVVRGRTLTDTAIGWTASLWSVGALLCVYLLYWVQVEVLAGIPWYTATSLLSASAVGLAGAGLTAILTRFTTPDRDLRPKQLVGVRAAVVTVLVAAIWLVAGSHRSGGIGTGQPRVAGNLPHIILIVLDTVRADFTSAHGFSLPVTPTVEKLAREGVQFLDAQSTASWTLPAVTSLMTSRMPGVAVSPGTYGAGSAGTALPEVLSDMGYSTVLVSSNPHVFGPFGIASRFDTVYTGRADWVPPSTIIQTVVERLFAVSDGELIDRAIRALDDEARPLFLYVHLMGGHAPYRVPPGYPSAIEVIPSRREIDFPTTEIGITPEELESLHSRYAATIRYADDQVARLLTALERTALSDSTLIVLTSDHGEEFGDHSGWTHGTTLYQEVLHVPMVWRWPGRIPAGYKRSGAVSLLDVAPTLLAAIDPDSSVPLLPSWRGRDLQVTAHVTTMADEARVAEVAPALRSLITNEWKYIVDHESQKEWLFNRNNDRAESTNLAPDRTDILARLRHELGEKLQNSAGALNPTESAVEDQEIAKKLRALGYIH